MPRKPPTHCRDCGRPREEVEHLSQRGLCSNCSAIRLTENCDGIAAKTGPAWERAHTRWIQAMRERVGDL